MHVYIHIQLYIHTNAYIYVCAQSLCTPSYPEEHLSLLSVHHFRGALDQGAYDDEMPDVFACRQCVLQLNLPANPSPLSRREKQCQDNGRNICSKWSLNERLGNEEQTLMKETKKQLTSTVKCWENLREFKFKKGLRWPSVPGFLLFCRFWEPLVSHSGTRPNTLNSMLMCIQKCIWIKPKYKPTLIPKTWGILRD